MTSRARRVALDVPRTSAWERGLPARPREKGKKEKGRPQERIPNAEPLVLAADDGRRRSVKMQTSSQPESTYPRVGMGKGIVQ